MSKNFENRNLLLKKIDKSLNSIRKAMEENPENENIYWKEYVSLLNSKIKLLAELGMLPQNYRKSILKKILETNSFDTNISDFQEEKKDTCWK